jgi:hypothetical protein
VTRRVMTGVAISLVLPAVAAGQQGRTPEARRDHIRMMEGVLTNAVRLGAEQVGRRMQAIDPTMTVLTGQARARGFVLDGYGVFFDVEVPTMSQSVVWSMQTVQRESMLGGSLDVLRRALELMPDAMKDGLSKQEVQQAFKRVQQQVTPLPGTRPASALDGAPPPGLVAPATVDNIMDDPGGQYTEAVKNALIDAMLDYSRAMNIGPEEWLTVAARDDSGPLVPNQIYESMTILLRIKGSDLAMLAADNSNRAEVRKKVEVRVF